MRAKYPDPFKTDSCLSGWSPKALIWLEVNTGEEEWEAARDIKDPFWGVNPVTPRILFKNKSRLVRLVANTKEVPFSLRKKELEDE